MHAAPSPSISSARDANENYTHMCLPKLRLPTFSGKYDEWLLFFDSFNSVIHANALLNNVRKFQYFKSALTGAAGNVVSSKEIFDTNYAIAWDLFRRRYNKRVIVQNYIKALIDLYDEREFYRTKKNRGRFI